MIRIAETDDVLWQGLQPMYEKVFHSISVRHGGAQVVVVVDLVIIDSNNQCVNRIIVGELWKLMS
jgi:SUMO ligase MMS21 Smc5/6 complex component